MGSAPATTTARVAARLLEFVVQRFPFARPAVGDAVDACGASRIPDRDASRIESLRVALRTELRRTLPAGDAAEDESRAGLIDACDGFLAREAIAASLSPDERREILRGMVLTRAVDNRLKQFFLASEVQYNGVAFQGKGFRSLGQEAIYAAAIRLRRGPAYRDDRLGWQGDVVGPIIRDLGVALAMRPEPAMVRAVLNAQMGKAGPPMDGRDLHFGDLEWGILPAAAPLAISTATIGGMRFS